MDTKVLSIKEISYAAKLLKAGSVVAFPTETVYGLGACIHLPGALHEIFHVKGRPLDNPLIVHISKKEQAERFGMDLPKTYYKLVEAFSPGPLTLIVKRAADVSALVSAGLPTIALRIPNHEAALALLEEVGSPLAAPSANLSGKPSPTCIQHVLDDFSGKIPAVLDGGDCVIGIESTVVDLVSFSHPTLMRPGSISKESIEEVLGHSIHLYSKQQGTISSPGMKYRHYAPEAIVTFFTQYESFRAYLEKHPNTGRLVLASEKIAGEHCLALSAQTLYFGLRYADKSGYKEVVLFCDERLQQDAGLMNRIQRIINDESHCTTTDCRSISTSPMPASSARPS